MDPGIPKLHGRLGKNETQWSHGKEITQRLLEHPRLQGMEVMMRYLAGEWQGTL